MRLRKSPRGRRSQSGFTLVEIMIVVMIIGVLLNICVPAMVHARDSGQARACIANLHNVNTAKEQWALQNNIPQTSNIPPTWLQLQPYMKSASPPVCPTTGTGYAATWGDIGHLPYCTYGGAGGSVPPHVF